MTETTQEINYFKDGLCMHCTWSRGGLYDFRHFHTEAESSWSNKDSQLQKQINEKLNKFPEEHHQDIIESFSWDMHQLQNQFPNIHRESLVITIFNFLEKQLNHLCNILSEYFSGTVKLNDLNGRGIRRALLYLSKVANIDFTKFKEEKDYILKVSKIRNQIVHNGGILPIKPSDPINIFISKNQLLHGSPGFEVILDPEFLYELIDTSIEFFEKLDGEIQMFITSQNG